MSLHLHGFYFKKKRLILIWFLLFLSLFWHKEGFAKFQRFSIVDEREKLYLYHYFLPLAFDCPRWFLFPYIDCHLIWKLHLNWKLCHSFCISMKVYVYQMRIIMKLVLNSSIDWILMVSENIMIFLACELPLFLQILYKNFKKSLWNRFL